MDRMLDLVTMELDPNAHRLRRVGRLSRRRMRIEAAQLANGVHSDGSLTVTISGLASGNGSADGADVFEWTANRPVALVIIRAGAEGDDVSFVVGPLTAGTARAVARDASGIRYVAFCYDSEPEPIGDPGPGRAHLRLATSVAGSLVRPSVMTRLLRAGRPATRTA
jgi:hypothetical protein